MINDSVFARTRHVSRIVTLYNNGSSFRSQHNVDVEQLAKMVSSHFNMNFKYIG